jgi:hypothetical protein
LNRYKTPSGWRGESYRHSLASRGVKTKVIPTISSLLPLACYSKMLTGEQLFGFQDNNQEKIIHSGWSKGNCYRYILEGAGDVFRELTKNHPFYSYIGEKLDRIEGYIKDVEKKRTDSAKWNEEDIKYMKKKYGLDPTKTNIHPEDSFEYAHNENKEKFEKMIVLWEKQPSNTKIQETAKRLNLDMLKKDFDDAKIQMRTIRKYFEPKVDYALPQIALAWVRAHPQQAVRLALWAQRKGFIHPPRLHLPKLMNIRKKGLTW